MGWDGRDEVIEWNNMANVTVRFCGWGPELDAGEGFRFHGTRLARWGTRRCVTDDDIVHTVATPFFAELTEGTVGDNDQPIGCAPARMPSGLAELAIFQASHNM